MSSFMSSKPRRRQLLRPAILVFLFLAVIFGPDVSAVPVASLTDLNPNNDPLFEMALELWTGQSADNGHNIAKRSLPVSYEDVGFGLSFLRSYGYLLPLDLVKGQLQSLDELVDGIKNMQKFAALPETGILDEATLDIMKAPRCGMPDMVGTSQRMKRYAVVPYGSKWDNHQLTYRILSYTGDMSSGQVRADIRAALEVWSDVSSLEFYETTDTSDIEISFGVGYHGDGVPFDGAGNVLAHAYYPGDEAISGDAHFDDSETWTSNTGQGTNLFQVAAHEFGHSLGLLHSNDPNALMFPYYRGYQASFTLPSDDVFGIQYLYGPNIEEVEEVAPPTNPPATMAPEPHGNDEPECNLAYDAISVIRGEIFMFTGDKFWRGQGRMNRAGWPISIFWFGAPESVDGFYERPDGKIVILQGRQYYVFDGNYVVYGRPLAELGLPNDVDAAFVWGVNGFTYVFKGDLYWRFDENARAVTYGYPRTIADNWKGIPSNIDSAFHYTDGSTYFFKDGNYWKFNNQLLQVDTGYPQPAGATWMGCDMGSIIGWDASESGSAEAAGGASTNGHDSVSRNGPCALPAVLTFLLVIAIIF